jgi:hypothetical protein
MPPVPPVAAAAPIPPMPPPPAAPTPALLDVVVTAEEESLVSLPEQAARATAKLTAEVVRKKKAE